MATKISLWIDTASDEHGWIVSQDSDTHSDTVETFAADDYWDARDVAMQLGRETGLEVVEERPAGSGQWTTLRRAERRKDKQ